MRRICLFVAAAIVLPLGNAFADEEPAPFTEKERSHWAFQAVRRPAVPRVGDAARTPIDAFVLEKLRSATGNESVGLSAPADRRTFIRRAKIDLLGLPPTPEEIEAFLADERPDAFERLIDRFLASPHYGEAAGRVWLDLVRFAETAGFNADPPRPLAYKYRDYVIRSFNSNKPYDRFVKEQIAGDELFPDDVDALVATGYNRMWPDESNASDVLLARQDALNDLTANVGAVFLGLTLGCAQCHDHKFDPLLQSDFYRMQAFFSGIVLEDRVHVATNDELAAHQRELNAWMSRTEDVRKELHELESQAKAKAAAVKRRKFPPKVLQAIDAAEEERTTLQRQLVFWSERQISLKEAQIEKQLDEKQRKRRAELKKQLAELKKERPKPPRTTDVMATVEIPSGPAKTFLLSGGSYESPYEEVQPGYLTVMLGKENQPAKVSSPRPGTSGRRATLANWLVDPRNPLTARVMVNRIWQEHFGRGLVSNANDFGTQTPPPSHPELLDWLASEFIDSGWDVKHMHRLIANSAVYRQSSFFANRASQRDADPENALLWHYPRRRLSSERIRDSFLTVSGRLSTKMLGPGVKPELPPNFSARHAWKPSPTAGERNRRSVYIYAKRNLPYPMMKSFDFPDMHESCAQRPQTTIAPQALMLLNSDLVIDAAKGFAERILRETSESDLEEIAGRAYLLGFGRRPDRDERKLAVAFIERQESVIREASKDGKSPETSARKRAVVDFCHALLNANEFLFIE